MATTTFTPQVNDNEGHNFAIDWGDGTALDERTNTNRNAVHTYAVNGLYTVKIIGLMPSAMSFLNEKRLTSIQSGFLQNTASSMQDYFRSCSNLTTIPGNLFDKSPAVTTFATTFYDCNLTSIPADLFKYNTAVTNFNSTFIG